MHRRHRPLLVERLETRLNPVVTAPEGFSVVTALEGLSLPTAMAFAPDGRILVTEKDGTLRVVNDDNLLPTPALTLDVQADGERGLLGVALDPSFAGNGFVYLYYTTTEGGVHNRVSRFTLAGNTIDPATEDILFELDPLSAATNHNGGSLRFGGDGKLYIAVGENALPDNAQSLATLHGKILRINRDGSIPADNPFVDQVNGRLEAIWALGLRNPFTFTVQPGTGRIFINDVGANTWEEINEGRAGANYGWPLNEGPTDAAGFDGPVFAYRHPRDDNDTFLEGFGYSITGGAFYTPQVSQFPGEYLGDYFYTDLSAGFIRRLDPETGVSSSFIDGLETTVALEVDAATGALYFFDFEPDGAGKLLRVEYDATQGAPVINIPPADLLVSTGQPATFRVTASGPGPLTYQWQRNGEDIPGATAATYTLPATSAADDGATFRVVVSNAAGSATSAAAELSITTDRPPVGTITEPAATARFVAGQGYKFRGTGTDPETGELPASAFSWEIVYVTGGIERPFLGATVGVTEGTFTIPTRTPFERTDVSYRIKLTLTDPAGLRSTTTFDFLPTLADITITNDFGAETFLSGQPFTGTIQGVAGLDRDVRAAQSVTFNGRRYVFASWSDGGARSHTISTPVGGIALEARYELVAPLATGAGTSGRVRVQQPDTGGVATVDVFPGLGGGVRVATGDVTGDGVPDIVAAAGPGGAPLVRVLDGTTNAVVREFLAFEESFRGGVYVAVADVNGDGIDDIVLSPDQGGGPRVRVLSGSDGAIIGDFFGIEDTAFRGGARVALGDLNNDGVPDLLVGAGFGGGPRVAVFDGTDLASGRDATVLPRKLFEDFFVFEDSLRNGVFPTLGDINGDGFGELIAGAGPGGAPRVLALSGADLTASQGATRTALTNFFAGNANDRTGVRIAAKDVDGDDRLDLVTGSGGTTVVTTYLGKDLGIEGGPSSETVDAFGGTGGVYVG